MRNRALVIALAILVAAIFWVNFGGMDWLTEKPIQIGVRNLSGVPAGGVEPLVFLLNRAVSLKTLRVVLVDEVRTNKFPHAVWELVAEKAPAPVTQFVYGMAIPGMKPRFGSAVPEKLEPNKAYLVTLQSGRQRAEREFVFKPTAAR